MAQAAGHQRYPDQQNSARIGPSCRSRRRSKPQGKIAHTKAQAISRVKNEEQRKDLLKEVIAQNFSLAQVKERVDSLKSNAAVAAEQSPLKTQIDDVLKLAKRSKIWDDPKKQKKLEKVLAELRSLVSDAV